MAEYVSPLPSYVDEEFIDKYTDTIPCSVYMAYPPRTVRRPVHIRFRLGKRYCRKESFIVYVVVTKFAHFYVGLTKRRIDKRWREHLGISDESGAKFLKDKDVAAFVDVCSTEHRSLARWVENHLTLQLTVKYGVENVTGGIYAEGRSVTRDIPKYNTTKYDFLGEATQLDPEPIPKSEAHPDFNSSLTIGEWRSNIGYSELISDNRQKTDRDSSSDFEKKYRDMMPVVVDGVYSPDILDCDVNRSDHRAHLYTVITENYQFYVGKTSRKPVIRWEEHLGDGRLGTGGVKFLQGKEIVAFVLVKEKIRDAEEAVDKLATQLAAKFGPKNVESLTQKHVIKGLKRYHSEDDTYDYLSEIDQLVSEPITASEAHPSLVLYNKKRKSDTNKESGSITQTVIIMFLIVLFIIIVSMIIM